MCLEKNLSTLPDLFEAHLSEFEREWQTNGIADWNDYCSRIPAGSVELISLLIQELAAIDIEMRWKNGYGPNVETYLALQPCLKDHGILLELISEEYRARRRLVPFISPLFELRFPEIQELVTRRIAEIDRDRINESSKTSISLAKRVAADDQISFEYEPNNRLSYDDYVIEKFIGSGGNGKVYRAFQKSINQKVAIKFLKKEFLRQPEVVRRFLIEADLVAQLRHPGIVNVHGSGLTKKGSLFFGMDWFPAGDLNQRLRYDAIPVPAAVRWVHEICLAIQFAHDNQVVHCDLKPANILLDDSDHAVVTDFGLARTTRDITDDVFRIEGTAGFMALEQAVPAVGEVGFWTDIYGIGAILYALLTGRAPYVGHRHSDILSQLIARRAVPAPSTLRHDIPKELEAICLQCLQHEPGSRPESARDVARQLGAIAITIDTSWLSGT